MRPRKPEQLDDLLAASPAIEDKRLRRRSCIHRR
jgi:hypothetical protein